MKELSILNRILVLSIVPKEGDLLTMKVIRGFREKVSFTANELAEFNLKNNEGMFTWDRSKERKIEFEITPKETEIIKEGLETLNKEKKLTEQFLELCDMFGIV